ncbi:MAG: alpha/beta hydrolase [Proteobacteria bacterium]|nr:alpha/beta hydrolase [Pseudomonadota bacterium]
MSRALGRSLSRLSSLAGSAGMAVAVPLFDRLIPRAGYAIRRDLAYGPHVRHRLDLYVPDAPSGTVLVYFYGGSWQSGSKAIYRFLGEAFARQGVLVAVVDYRLYPEVKYPAFIEDGAMAVRFMRDRAAEHGGDAGRLFVSGHSAGAYIATMLGVNATYLEAVGAKPSDLRGVIGIAGPYDFLPVQDPALVDIFGGGRNMATQPIKYAASPAPPMLLAHGTADRIVGAGNTRRFATRLLQAGNKVQVKLFDGVGHLGIVMSLAHGLRKRTSLYHDMLAFIANC